MAVLEILPQASTLARFSNPFIQLNVFVPYVHFPSPASEPSTRGPSNLTALHLCGKICRHGPFLNTKLGIMDWPGVCTAVP